MKSFFILIFCLTGYFYSNGQVIVNRHEESKVSGKGLYGVQELKREIVMPEIDVAKTLEKWKREKLRLKFAEPITTDIYPLTNGLVEKVGDYTICRLKITAKNAASITLYFDQLELSRNAEVFIYNIAGTVITGPITYKENIAAKKLWGSNVFSDSSVIVEVRVLSKEINQNKLHISKILYGVKRDNSKDLDNTDSTAGPGFGRSSVCNVNVICYSPWANESRAVAEIGDGHGGWFTGALVMNTCNTNRPYILTAWHCVVQSGGTFVPSTFEFLWISPTCATTTNTTQTILFNGSSIAALWEQTDFALVVLDQNIPQNSGLSFLGWSRSTTIPVGAVGIHHPKGDIMKISMDNDAALVGNIKTYLNKAWRVQWDIGIVQDGSSGSPLFNLDHKLIGQLYSSSQPEDPPCNQPIGGANYGRFDQSWEGGGTPNTRLKDWLILQIPVQ